MLRTNLSTRPFYNERAVHLLLALAGVVVVVLTAFNAIRIIALSRQNTELSSLINRDHDEAQRLTREAQRIRAGINQAELEATANAAALANSLIDQRTFSWTEFFNHIEETLPPDVMLTSVRELHRQRDHDPDDGARPPQRRSRRVHGEARGDGGVRLSAASPAGHHRRRTRRGAAGKRVYRRAA